MPKPPKQRPRARTTIDSSRFKDCTLLERPDDLLNEADNSVERFERTRPDNALPGRPHADAYHQLIIDLAKVFQQRSGWQPGDPAESYVVDGLFPFICLMHVRMLIGSGYEMRQPPSQDGLRLILPDQLRRPRRT